MTIVSNGPFPPGTHNLAAISVSSATSIAIFTIVGTLFSASGVQVDYKFQISSDGATFEDFGEAVFTALGTGAQTSDLGVPIVQPNRGQYTIQGTITVAGGTVDGTADWTFQ